MKLGVSPRRLSGWEPKQVTRYEYDDTGRLIGSVTECEPEWCSADREALLAYIEMTRVGPHGQPVSESTSRDGDPTNPNRKYRYQVEVIKDFASAAQSKFIEDYKARYGEAVNMDELRFLVRKVEL